MDMNKIAVLTGDIVNSQKNTGESNVRLLAAIQETFIEIEAALEIKILLEMWRGDSFQALVEKPEMAMNIALLFRAGLKSKTESNKENKSLWDARIGIGIGEMTYKGETVATSNGEAFVNSGTAFDQIEKSRYFLNVLTPWPEVTMELSVSVALADVIITSWSKKQAEAIYLYQLYDNNQVSLAKKMNISQPALQNRINVNGNFYRIDLFLKRFTSLIKAYAN